MKISGPIGMHEYLGHGKFKSGKKELSCKKLGMMSGGTGITPMLQVIAAILKDPSDKTEVSLLYANQTDNVSCIQAKAKSFAKMSSVSHLRQLAS